MIVLLREREACELSPDCGIVTRCPPLRQAQAPTRDSSAGGVPKQEPECVRKHRGSENVITIKDWDALRPVVSFPQACVNQAPSGRVEDARPSDIHLNCGNPCPG